MSTLLLTIEEVAEELRISPDSVYRLISAGDLQTVNVGTGRRSRTRVTRVALEKFAANRTSDRPARSAS